MIRRICDSCKNEIPDTDPRMILRVTTENLPVDIDHTIDLCRDCMARIIESMNLKEKGE